jgi:predicted RNA-binding protein with RPS1 domain
MQIPLLTDDRRFYVYEHLRADTGEVFYVGKGTRKRAQLATRHHRSKWWQRVVEKAGGFSIRYCAQGLTDNEAKALEIAKIAELRAMGVDLCNMTNGGDGTSGYVKSAEWRRKVGLAHKGKIITPEVREKISNSVRANKYKHTPAARAKISAALMGKKNALGFKHSEEWKRKQKLALTGNKSRTGQKRSAEERAKSSAALSGRVQGKLTCPHCGKEGGNAMRRWHFDNCSTGVALAN